MDGPTFWALACTAAFCVGLAKGGIPAFGALAVPILTLTISPVAAAGIILPVLVFSDVFGVWAYRREFSVRVLKIAAVGIVIGTGLGWATAHLVSEDFVRVLIGLIALMFSLNYLFRGRNHSPRDAGWRGGLVWTSIAGFTSFVSHAGAPPWQVWVLPQGLPKMVFAGTTTIAFAYMNALKILPYHMLGQLSLGNLQISAVLALPALAGVFIGYRLVRVMPERIFYSVVTWLLFALSIKLIWDGFTG